MNEGPVAGGRSGPGPTSDAVAEPTTDSSVADRAERGCHIEHEDGRVWQIVGASSRAVRVAMPDGRRVWLDRGSLRRQLADEPVTLSAR